MDILVLIGLTISLLAIAYEDWQTRSVHTYWFALVFLSISFLQINTFGFLEYLQQYLINFVFILFYFALLQLYVVIKHRIWVWIFDRYIGWGDIVFIFCVAGYWDLLGFIAYLILSLIIALLLYLFLISGKKTTIPLAGFQALVFFLFFYLEQLKILPLDQYMSDY